MCSGAIALSPSDSVCPVKLGVLIVIPPPIVRSLKACKVELDRSYPCPCRQRGTLQPIALMDALGCNRCQQIFVVDDAAGDRIEQVSAGYVYRRMWRWTGARWLVVRPPLADNYWTIALCALSILVLAWLPLILKGLAGSGAWVGLGLLTIGLPIVLLWLAYRR